MKNQPPYLSIQSARFLWFFLLLGILCSDVAFAQNPSTPQARAAQDQAVREAFAVSYKAEASQDYRGAIQAMETLGIETVHAIYEVNLRMGWLSYKAGDNDRSALYYMRAMVLAPQATEPLWGILMPYTAKEEWVKAEKIYKDLLKLDPKNGTANYQLGLIYYYRQNYPEALKYLEVSLKMSPFDYYSMLMNGWTRYFMGQKDEAKMLFERVLRHTPQDASALEGLGLIQTGAK
jgi:tetratricopeptide (TPR) repeat protein